MESDGDIRGEVKRIAWVLRAGPGGRAPARGCREAWLDVKGRCKGFDEWKDELEYSWLQVLRLEWMKGWVRIFLVTGAEIRMNERVS